MKKTKKEKKNNKKKILILAALVAITIAIIIIFNFMNKKDELYIEIASTDIGYSYGPNNQTEALTKINDEIKLNIISNKKDKVKCYSTDENVVSINVKNIGTALSNGSTDIYCKVGNTKSNIINVKVGE